MFARLIGSFALLRSFPWSSNAAAGWDPWGNVRTAFTAKTSIDRKDVGLTWNQVLETGGVMVGDRVDIEAEIEAVKPRLRRRFRCHRAAPNDQGMNWVASRLALSN